MCPRALAAIVPALLAASALSNACSAPSSAPDVADAAPPPPPWPRPACSGGWLAPPVNLSAGAPCGASATAVAVGGWLGAVGTIGLATALESGGCAPTVDTLPREGSGSFAPLLNATLGDGLDLATADFNGDGQGDLVVAATPLTVLLGSGTDTFSVAPDGGVTGCARVVTADFDRDGRPDVACVGTSLEVLLGRGDGTFELAFSTEIMTPGPCLSVGDFNGDGVPDLATCDEVYLGLGDGTFNETDPWGPQPETQGDILAAGDFNGDGLADVLLAEGETLVVATSEVDPLQPNPVRFGVVGGTEGPPAASVEPARVVVADVDGNGWPDAVWLTSSGTVSFALGFGDGRLSAPLSFATPLTGEGLAVADLDQDGKVDVVASGANGGAAGVSVLYGCPPETLDAAVEAATEAGPVDAGCAGCCVNDAGVAGMTCDLLGDNPGTWCEGLATAMQTSPGVGVVVAPCGAGGTITLTFEGGPTSGTEVDVYDSITGELVFTQSSGCSSGPGGGCFDTCSSVSPCAVPIGCPGTPAVRCPSSRDGGSDGGRRDGDAGSGGADARGD